MGRMEHRCGTRHPLSADVSLLVHGTDAVRGRIREASISGMFVEVSPDVCCDHGVIEVEVVLTSADEPQVYRWQVMVVRRTEEGIGLLFDRLHPPAITRLLAGAEGQPATPVRLPDNVTPLRIPGNSRQARA